MNHVLGWLLVAAGFGWAVWLDPWSMRAPAAEVLAARQAQGVLLAMALLQLLVGRLLRGGFTSGPRARTVSLTTAAGALAYAGGYVLQLAWPNAGSLIVAGALLNAAGFGPLAVTAARQEVPPPVRIALGVLVFGTLLDAVMGLRGVLPAAFPAYLGAEDEVRLRMLRLARVAAIALPVQAILFQETADRAGGTRLVRWAGLALAVGALGMPLILTSAAFGPAALKYLLPLPADAVLFGSGAAAWLAFRKERVSERWGWSLVFGSMVVGLLLGGFAFEGPLPAPAAFTGYLDPVRSLTRLGHAYAIVLGLLMLFLPSHARPVIPALLVAGTLTTLAGMTAVAALEAPAVALALGPGLASASALLMLGEGRAGARRKARPGS